MSNETFKSDPALYREMSVPHESVAAASDETRAFVEAVSAARVKHRIRDVLVVMQLGVIRDDGQEVSAQTRFSFGDRGATVEMAAYAFGAETREQSERLDKLASGAVRGAGKE